MRLLACFALGALLMAATPAFAGKACGGPCQQLPPSCGYDNFCGGGGGDPCGQCQAAAYTRYTTTVANSCNSFPVNLFGWTIAICINTAQGVLSQDLINCSTDNQCA